MFYALKRLFLLPLLPFLYLQGKRVRKQIPSLPEAEGTDGFVENKETGEEISLLVLGESTMAGVGAATHKEGFAGQLAGQLSQRQSCSVNWSVRAKSGYTAEKVRCKIGPQLDKRPIDFIVIGLGANDSFAFNSPVQWREEVKMLIEDLRKCWPATGIYFVSMPPIKEFPAFTPLMRNVLGLWVKDLGAELKRAVKNFDHVYFNEEHITLASWSKKHGYSADPELYFSDGVHPSSLTYQLYAKDMAAFITEQEKSRTAAEE